MEMELSRGMPLTIGKITGMIYGGPFREFQFGTRRLVGVKMAVELKNKCDFKVDTKDFSVPSEEDMQKGIVFALQSLTEGKDVYVGCMGGIGRTGLFMGCIAKVARDYYLQRSESHSALLDPVKYVRKHYKTSSGHVPIETEEQQDWVTRFDTAPILDWLLVYEQSMTTLVEVEVIKEVEVEKIVYLSPWAWAKKALFGI